MFFETTQSEDDDETISLTESERGTSDEETSDNSGMSESLLHQYNNDADDNDKNEDDEDIGDEDGAPMEQSREPCYGFKIVGDNIDKNVNPRYMRCDRQTRSLHFFNSCAILDRIDLSEYHSTPFMIHSSEV